MSSGWSTPQLFSSKIKLGQKELATKIIHLFCSECNIHAAAGYYSSLFAYNGTLGLEEDHRWD